MKGEHSPLVKLFETLVAEEKLDPILAKQLLKEILEIIATYQEK